MIQLTPYRFYLPLHRESLLPTHDHHDITHWLSFSIEDLFDDCPARTFDEITEVIEKVANNASLNECSNTFIHKIILPIRNHK